MSNRPQFKRSPIAAGLLIALGSSPAIAQEQADNQSAAVESIEEIVVTGIRSSLKASMDLKRDSAGVVDAITAEDIGDFPDTNLAESLQRITGVSIDRERGEGAKVTVRGMGPQFNLVLLNGRQLPTHDGLSRSFDFGNLASEGVSAVEVYKTGQANVPTGGIGATLNIRTTRPLDDPGFTFTAAASGMHDQSSEEGDDFTPEISALISNTFAEDTFGVALSLVRQERNNGAATANVGGWRSFQGDVNNCWCGVGRSEWGGIPIDDKQQNRPGDDDLYGVPQAIGYELAEWSRTRTNGQVTLEWQATDQIRARVDQTYSSIELERTYNNFSAWFNFGGQESIWTDGPQASPLTYTENTPLNPDNGRAADFSMGSGADAIQTENNSTGLNLLWDVNANLSLELDYHSSSAEFAPDSPFGDSALLSTAAYTREVTSGHFAGELPVLELGLARPLSAEDMIVTGSVFTHNVNEMNIDQTRMLGNYEFDAGFVEGIDFGIEMTEVDNKAQGSVVQRDAWGGVTQPGAIADLMVPASIDGRFDNVSGSDNPALRTDFFTYDFTQLVARTEQLIASGDAELFQSADLGPCGTGLCASPDFTADRRTTEESVAAFVQARFEMQWGTMPAAMRFGLRYEETDVASAALSPAYTQIRQVAGNEFSLTREGSDFTNLEGDYSVVLPNFDFRIDLTDNWVGRFSYSKTISRPSYSDIQGGLTVAQIVRVDGGDGNRGNPALEPLESDNLDFSLEWYYGADSYISVGYFEKEVVNFVGTTEVVETSFNLPHPALGPLYEEARAATGSPDSGVIYNWILANRADAEGVDAAAKTIAGVAGRDPASPFRLIVPQNSDEVAIDGWEINIQHAFGETGFGFIANYTIADSDIEFDNFALVDQFAIYGLSDSANVIAFYENYGFSVRLAYNWRDDFLAGEGQANVGALPPTYTAAYEQYDLSANYWINDSFQVFVDVINLTDETSHVYGRDKLQTLFAAQTGTRYNMGFRYKF